MKDNYLSSYGTTNFIIKNQNKFWGVSIFTGILILFSSMVFSVFGYLGKAVDAHNGSFKQKHQTAVLGDSEKTVRAEEEFFESVTIGKTVSIEERTRILKKVSSEIYSRDRRDLVLRAYLETMLCSDGSIPPLADYTSDIIQSADKYGLDWRYTTAIAGVESWFGCAGGADGYRNAWGYGGGPATRFRYDSWPEGIEAYTKGLVEGYGTKIDFYQMASYYTRGVEGTNDRWADGVTKYLLGIDSINKEL